MQARLLRSLRPSRLVALLLIALAAQSAVFSRPCYKRTGGAMVCRNSCNAFLAVEGLTCPGGVWSVADLDAMEMTLNDKCVSKVKYNSIPRPKHTSGNEKSGYQSQGNFVFTCGVITWCAKRIDWLGPLAVQCIANEPIVCKRVQMFTAGGQQCPAGGGSGGGGTGDGGA